MSEAETVRTRKVQSRPEIPDHSFGSTTTTWSEKTSPIYMGEGESRVTVANLVRTPETGWQLDESGVAYVGSIGEHASLINAQHSFASAYDNRHLRAARIAEAREKLLASGISGENADSILETLTGL